MKYDKKYPDTKAYQKTGETEANIWHGGDPKLPCKICGVLTHFLDADFLAHLCSEECSTKWWDNYTRNVSGETRGCNDC